MNRRGRFTLIPALATAAAVPIVLSGFSTGPPPRVTGAPGDSAAACTQCHAGTLNSFGGSVEILLPGGAQYTPGVVQRVQVRITDAEQQRWGFELSPRLNSDLVNGRAGSVAPSDGNTQAICEGTCTDTSVQFIEHTSVGTRNGTAGPVIFEFDWTPPSSDAGPVTLYVAANAANGNGNNSGDHIYTRSIELQPAAAAAPTIGENGVSNGATFVPGTIGPTSWISVFGSDLSSTTRGWTDSDIVDGNLPTSLDGVSVTVDGQPAYVAYISPTQINALAPGSENSGSVGVQVTTPLGTSNSASVQLAEYSPGFFLFDGKYLAATHADGSLLGAPGLLPDAPDATTPATPGEVVVFYGTGFGDTDPAIPEGHLVTEVSNISSDLQITVGGMDAAIQFAGLIPEYAGLYQFNVQLPDNLASGDHPVVATVGGVESPASESCCFVTVQ